MGTVERSGEVRLRHNGESINAPWLEVVRRGSLEEVVLELHSQSRHQKQTSGRGIWVLRYDQTHATLFTKP